MNTITAAILNSVVSNSYYGMLRAGGRLIIVYLPPKHPIIAILNNRILNGHHIPEKVHWFLLSPSALPQSHKKIRHVAHAGRLT